jgi:hypothetical protein
LELYFNTSRPDDSGQDIYVARRASTSAAFGAPELFLAAAGSPFLSADGLKFFFVTPTLGGLGQDDFYVMTRAHSSDEFGSPIHLADISSPQEDFGLILSPDGTTVYFSSTRPGVPLGGPFGEYGMWQATVLPPGDFNGDGAVDTADYVWRKGMGTTYTQADYDVWRANFGRTVGSGAAVNPPDASVEPFSAMIPEPSSFALVAMGFLAAPCRRRR